jgi:hypothetical protein
VKYELGLYILEGDIRQSHRRENLKSYISPELFTTFLPAAKVSEAMAILAPGC